MLMRGGSVHAHVGAGCTRRTADRGVCGRGPARGVSRREPRLIYVCIAWNSRSVDDKVGAYPYAQTSHMLQRSQQPPSRHAFCHAILNFRRRSDPGMRITRTRAERRKEGVTDMKTVCPLRRSKQRNLQPAGTAWGTDGTSNMPLARLSRYESMEKADGAWPCMPPPVRTRCTWDRTACNSVEQSSQDEGRRLYRWLEHGSEAHLQRILSGRCAGALRQAHAKVASTSSLMGGDESSAAGPSHCVAAPLSNQARTKAAASTAGSSTAARPICSGFYPVDSLALQGSRTQRW